MGKFDGVLLCTDLDETLLSTDKTVSKANLEAIEYFKKVFVRVFVTLSISLPLPYMVYLNMEEGLVRMCVVFLTIIITNVIMIWLFGMTSVERGKVKDLIEKKIRKC